MRLLQLHSDFIEYEPISKEIKDAEENVSKTKVRLEDLVVTLIAIEVNDDKDIANNAVNEIKKYMDNVKSKRLLIYPYAHLSSCLASPATAAEIIKSVEQIAKELLVEVHRAPFGWTKAFQIKVKGHPLAENAKVLTKQYSVTTNASSDIGSAYSGTTITTQSEEKVSSALKSEEKLQSFWYVLQPNRELTPINEYKFKSNEKNLRTLTDYEMAKKRTVDEQPPHVRLMKKLAIADYEPSSDVGNMRYYPKGRLMKSLIEQYVTRRVMEY